MNVKIRIKIGSSVFNTTLSNNATATEFKAMLPMTINMSDLNRNEKFYDFANALTTNASNSSIIQTGDLMLYGNRTLVLFYKTFSTLYSYTRLGRIDDTTRLTEALGNGDVSITFELQ
ncbi:cyclophilin-like fold protein [Flavobacterium sp. ZT3R25]|uniref:cyclophilin-like fold protein n=1 Tax=Flavobacterium galactosi TaxID=3398735 RepID=UPI003A86BC5A